MGNRCVSKIGYRERKSDFKHVVAAQVAAAGSVRVPTQSDETSSVRTTQWKTTKTEAKIGPNQRRQQDLNLRPQRGTDF
jgi:hypothetical protein